MKTAISIPDSDFEHFERIAARHGMNRSEFFRRAGRRLVEEREGEAELTALSFESTSVRLVDRNQQSAGQPSSCRRIGCLPPRSRRP